MEPQVLREVMGSTLPDGGYTRYAPAFNEAMRLAGITNVNRAAQWCAQLGHECVGFKYLTEIADGWAYEGRKDLGNTQPGDGPRYRGRGAIMVTGRANYSALSKWAHSQGLVPTATYFVDNPEQLASERYAFTGAVWYWTAARPQINRLADAGDLEGVTRAINGGLNGLADRRARYQNALTYGTRLLPGEVTVTKEKQLDYPRDAVAQDTYYYCGPASTQTIIRAATGELIPERDLAAELGTHTGGTDYIGQFPAVLDRHIDGAQYRHRDMPNDPPTHAQKEQLWADIVGSIDAGHGVVANIVAPPSNYPRAVAPSTISPAYRGGTVYHYIALLGYAGDGASRRVWVADSGFAPFGYWIGFDQLATLIPPKGYAYSVSQPKEENTMGSTVLGGVSAAALNDTKLAAQEARDVLAGRYKSLVNPDRGFTLAQYVALIDRAVWEQRQLVYAIAHKLGLDPERIIADAIARDKEGSR